MNKNVLIFIFCAVYSFSLFSQQRITGVVYDDETGETLPGVNIVIKGTQTGVITDIDGAFSITVSSGDILEFSFIGYQRQEVRVDSQTGLVVRLLPALERLDEFVVIGYSVQRKSDLTGSVISISADELRETPAVNVASALQGRAAGVMVTSPTGMPGTDPQIRIRGESSILQGNDPLIIIDGMPGGNLNMINMDDIASFEILKDAAASSIYGSAGANGVIIITTKRGESGKPRINFSSKIGTRHFPPFHDVLNSEQMFDYLKEVLPSMHNFSDVYNVNWDAIAEGTIDTTNFVNNNWQDIMFGTGSFEEYSLSFSGGTDNLAYRVSGSYLNDVGIIKPAEFERWNFRANFDNQVHDRIKISGDAYASYTDRITVTEAGLGWNGGMVNSALQMPPFIPVYDDSTGFMFPNPLRPNVDSPFALANGSSANSTSTGLNGNFKIDVQIIDGLNFRSEWFGNLYYSNSQKFTDRNNTSDGRDLNGSATASNIQRRGITYHNILQYQTEVKDHNIFALVGQIGERSNSASMGMRVIDFPSDYIVLLTQGNIRESIVDSRSEFLKYSFISRINYTYKDKYLFQINARADGSPVFGPGNRWGFFPSASVGWKISDEPFMDRFTHIDMLKIRAGLGNTGNDQIPPWQWMATYTNVERNQYDIYGNDQPISYFAPARNSNSELKWESTIDYSAGIDVIFDGGRLDLALDFYLRDSYDLLYTKPLPFTTGYRFVPLYFNMGKVRNQGVELVITSRIISTPVFNWRTNLNVSFNDNKVLDIGGDNEATFGRWSIVEGKPINVAWVHQVDRIFQYDDFDLVHGNYVLKDHIPVQPGARPGDIKFVNHVDDEGEFVIDNKDRVFMGPAMPPWVFGMNNSFSYRNFTLSLFVQGVYGNMIYNDTRVTSEGMKDYFNQFTSVLNRWTPENTDTDMPRPTTADLNRNTRDSDRFLEDGWYLRLKDITLSYVLPRHLTSIIGIDNANIFFTGQNWITFTRYSGYDPEVGYNDNGNYPQVRTLILGLNVSI